MEPVEIIARARCKALGGNPDWRSNGQPFWHRYVADIKADLTALQEAGWRLDAREGKAGVAYWTHENSEVAGHLYYFGLDTRQPPPYRTQRHVDAILDIAADGTLAGVELIENMPPPPHLKAKGGEQE